MKQTKSLLNVLHSLLELMAEIVKTPFCLAQSWLN